MKTRAQIYSHEASGILRDISTYGKSSSIIDPNGDMTRAEMPRSSTARSGATRRRIFRNTRMFPRVSGTTKM